MTKGITFVLQHYNTTLVGSQFLQIFTTNYWQCLSVTVWAGTRQTLEIYLNFNFFLHSEIKHLSLINLLDEMLVFSTASDRYRWEV